jgi:hypothetical protein
MTHALVEIAKAAAHVKRKSLLKKNQLKALKKLRLKKLQQKVKESLSRLYI